MHALDCFKDLRGSVCINQLYGVAPFVTTPGLLITNSWSVKYKTNVGEQTT